MFFGKNVVQPLTCPRPAGGMVVHFPGLLHGKIDSLLLRLIWMSRLVGMKMLLEINRLMVKLPVLISCLQYMACCALEKGSVGLFHAKRQIYCAVKH